MLSDEWKQRLRIQRRRSDYRAVFEGEAGRAVLHDLMRRNFVLSTTIVVGEPQMTAFNEGRRAAVLDILQELRMTGEQIEQLTKERAQDE
jgi:hypothetical protein